VITQDVRVGGSYRVCNIVVALVKPRALTK